MNRQQVVFPHFVRSYHQVEITCSYRVSFPAVRMRFGRSFYNSVLAAILLLKVYKP